MESVTVVKLVQT